MTTPRTPEEAKEKEGLITFYLWNGYVPKEDTEKWEKWFWKLD